jgi:hypothetical protein
MACGVWRVACGVWRVACNREMKNAYRLFGDCRGNPEEE